MLLAYSLYIGQEFVAGIVQPNKAGRSEAQLNVFGCKRSSTRPLICRIVSVRRRPAGEISGTSHRVGARSGKRTNPQYYCRSASPASAKLAYIIWVSIYLIVASNH
jgi:hypothetical protein